MLVNLPCPFACSHSEGFKMDVDGQWILKLCSPIEKVRLPFDWPLHPGADPSQAVFERLQDETALLSYVPQYQGVVDAEGKQYIKLENLVAHFREPCVMDVKMGVR